MNKSEQSKKFDTLEAQDAKPSRLERRESMKQRRALCFKIMKYFGRVFAVASVIAAVIIYIAESDDRRKAKHYQAWQVINLAQGKKGIDGRIDALQELNEDKVQLKGLDISEAYLPKLNLPRAILVDANLTGANLQDANLSGANLKDTNLSGSDLRYASLTRANLARGNLTRANLESANLAEAYLFDANLAEAYLSYAKLTDASLIFANLSQANLCHTVFTGANLRYVNLTGADIRYANFKNIQYWQEIKSIEYANIYGITNPPDGFMKWAIEHGAISIEHEEEWKRLTMEKEGEVNNSGEGLREDR